MRDPSTLAFDIKSPFTHKPKSGFSYKNSLISIWHVDPLRFKENHIYRRDDDSCGWFAPPYSSETKTSIEKLSHSQYREIFSRQVAEREEKSYASVCNVPDCYSAIYWSWRAVKHLYKPKTIWQWGCKLTLAELEHIYSLATCPVGNLQVSFSQIKDEESFKHFFFLIFSAYLRHHRPWYKHPKYHFWHWKIQIHPLQQFKRWAFSRCGTCNKNFSWGYSPVTHSWNNGGPKWFKSERDVHHSECLNQKPIRNP